MAKAIEVLDFQIEKLYEDKLKALIKDNDFSRMYEKKVNERNYKTKKFEELNTVKFDQDKQVTIYYKFSNLNDLS